MNREPELISPTFESSWEFTPPWAPWITLLLLAFATALIFGIYVRERSNLRISWALILATIRWCLFATVLWMLYGVTIRPFRTDLPDLLILLDDSESMSIEDSAEVTATSRAAPGNTPRGEDRRGQAATRLNQAKRFLLADDMRWVKSLMSDYQVKLITLSSSSVASADDLPQLQATIQNTEPTLPQSRLGNRLREILEAQRGRPTAAVVIFSDGVTTEGRSLSEASEYARLRGVPLYPVGAGTRQGIRDIEVSDLLADDVAFVNDMLTFEFTVSAKGYQGQSVEVVLRQAGRPEILARESLSIDSPQMSQRARLTYRPQEVGEYEFEIEALPHVGEATSANNRRSCHVSVREETLKVLLVQGYPSYEFQFLKTLLGRKSASQDDPSEQRSTVKLDVVLQDADPEFANIDADVLSGFPPTERLREYDLCIFGDVNPDLLSERAMIDLRDFVITQGRAVVLIAGPRYFPHRYHDTPLADIVPFEIAATIAPGPDVPIPTGFVPRLTPLGLQVPHLRFAVDPLDNQKTWNELPPWYWFLEIPAVKPATRVLVEHPQRTNGQGQLLPLVMLSYVGAGKVIFHATDDTWRWRFQRGDELFARYWMQTLRYLSRFKLGENREAELTSDREQYRRGDLVKLRARFLDERQAPTADDGVTVLLSRANRDQRRVALRRETSVRGEFSVTLPALPAGDYHGSIVIPTLPGNAPSCDFSVTIPDSESARIEMDVADMSLAAERSRGKYLAMQDAEKLAESLPAGRQVRIEALPPRRLWDDWRITSFFFLLLIGEWLLRKRRGLL